MHQGVVSFEDLKACRRGAIQTAVSARILLFDLGNGTQSARSHPQLFKGLCLFMDALKQDGKQL